MAVKLSTQKCSDCQGALLFNKSLKQFECPYCGKIYEKNYQFEKIQIDGMAGINDMVRATIIDLSKYDFKNAESNLSGCEKINHNYIGTKIANLSYYLLKSIYVKDETNKLSNSKAKIYASEIKNNFPLIDDEEKALYDYLDSSELYAILFIVYNFSGLKDKANYINNFLNLFEILNTTTNKSLFSIFLKTNQCAEIDKMMTNIDFLDKRYTLYEILKYYNDGDKKRDYIQKLFDLNAFSYKDDVLINKYLLEINDSSFTKLLVLSNAYKLKINVELTEILEKIFSKDCIESDIINAFSVLEKIKLSSDDAKIILTYCLSPKCENIFICKLGLNSLKNNNSLYEIYSDDIIEFIKETSFKFEEQKEILELIFKLFKINLKSFDKLTTFVLLDYDGNEENRYELIQYILKKVSSITLQTLNNYFLLCKKDTHHKVEIAKIIINELGINKSYYNNLLSNYIINSEDDMETKSQIIEFLLSVGCVMNAEATKILLTKSKVAENLIDIIFSQRIVISEDVIEEYFKNLNNSDEYNSYLISKLINYHFKVTTKTIEKYLFQITENEIVKSQIALMLIENNISPYPNNYTFEYQGDTILGNIAQYYLLTSNDAKSDKYKIINSLIKNKVKLSNPMIVDRKSISFKKYIISKKETLNSETDSLCTKLGVYKLFF